MGTWRISYTVDAVGDTPVPRTTDVTVDDGLDEQATLDQLRAAAREHGGQDATLTDAEPADD